MKKSFVIVATLFGALIGHASNAGEGTAINGRSGNTLTLAVYGDWPYSTTLLSQAPLLINSINSDPDVALVLHVGELMASLAASLALPPGDSLFGNDRNHDQTRDRIGPP
ncbi:MAG: hypothetical protein JWO48_600 [Bryobacterales bacterium]|nr:hypothetical protein [Bryobacterales bacterium]